MKITYVDKKDVPFIGKQAKGKHVGVDERDWVAIIEKLLDNPNEVAKITVEDAEEAKKVQMGVYSSSGIRARLGETQYRVKSHRKDRTVAIWLERRSDKTGTRG
jgi:hypothetical protein